MLSLARDGVSRGDLARLALAAGYADRAHMTAECTRLAGVSPGRLLSGG
jgi:AraC-like DNA-binding protein